ncbi:hypothetical protein GCM10022214_00100 [Actinomadura miaoliensis]|uniref:Uncharacterized protein n=1 Tax=Actinomadura miaoliensis TaxID=430685 RepID=A0ABP7UVF1_9ACTN
MSQAAARRAEARDNHAPGTISARSFRVSSPIRLARSSTDRWPSKCTVVKYAAAIDQLRQLVAKGEALAGTGDPAALFTLLSRMMASARRTQR